MKFAKFLICFLTIFMNILSNALISSKRVTHLRVTTNLLKSKSKHGQIGLQKIGLYADLSLLAYHPSDVEGKEELEKRGWTYVGSASNEKYNSYAFVAYDLKRTAIVFVFRGTDNFRNWKTNCHWKKAEITPAYPTGVCIHAGFFKLYLSLEEQLDYLVFQAVHALLQARKEDSEKKEITFEVTGHSLGGTAATLYARHLNVLDYNSEIIEPFNELTERLALPKVVFKHHIKLYTFGVPRIGNQLFADIINSILGIQNIYNMIFNNDPVPRANAYNPEKYVHVGMIYKCVDTVSCVKYMEDFQDSVHLSNPLHLVKVYKNKNDHSVRTYARLGYED